MRRYLFDGSLQDVPVETFDVVVVGQGIAGLYTALRLDPALSCAILSKSDPHLSSSWLAQGGIAAVMIEEDTRAAHIQDTLTAGAGLCDEKAVRTLIAEGPRDVQTLIDWGVPFDLDDAGNIVLTREGGHSASRILHCGGDATGQGVTQRLAEIAAGRPNIWMRDPVFLVDILVEDGEVAGILAWENGYRIYRAPHVVLCTGGIGQNYEYTTNPSTSTGDGIAAAIRAGARVKDMEFVQFHPTALLSRDPSRRFFLISEAVRGEGAVLRNAQGERFMSGVHPMAELAPRDIVTRAIIREMERTKSTYVFLDSTHRSAEHLSTRFPTIYAECLKQGIDIARQWIPVRPVQHYMMGGIHTGLDAMSSLPGLYAVGETACTGVHGANRLASNSLLECLVFGRRCAQAIGASERQARTAHLADPRPSLPIGQVDLPEVRWLLRHRMMKNGGILRRTAEMQETLTFVEEVADSLESVAMSTLDHVEILDMATVARAVLTAALARKQSVGAHYREDDSLDSGKEPTEQ
ncbi:MAG TPA: L-aspartate oxidase [Clostridia bacterium]